MYLCVTFSNPALQLENPNERLLLLSMSAPKMGNFRQWYYTVVRHLCNATSSCHTVSGCSETSETCRSSCTVAHWMKTKWKWVIVFQRNKNWCTELRHLSICSLCVTSKQSILHFDDANSIWLQAQVTMTGTAYVRLRMHILHQHNPQTMCITHKHVV